MIDKLLFGLKHMHSCTFSKADSLRAAKTELISKQGDEIESSVSPPITEGIRQLACKTGLHSAVLVLQMVCMSAALICPFLAYGQASIPGDSNQGSTTLANDRYVAAAVDDNAIPDVDLEAKLKRLQVYAEPGELGISVLDLESGQRFGGKQSEEFPQMSVIKAPVAAAVLNLIDSKKISLEQTVQVTRADLVEGSAVPSLGDQIKHGGSRNVSVGELLTASVSQSDNTAVDVLLKLIGGPGTAPISFYDQMESIT